ncbi:hypothetical protein BJF80_00710 [Serinicoccus sp. CUA-874]|nr:hypothetical protein BJF80_00710 [Serinicoccus sp. CUA-874]
MCAHADDPTLVEHDDLVASMIVETRWATTTTVASRVHGRSACRNLASVATSRAEKESSKR